MVSKKQKRRIGIAVTEELDNKLQRVADALGVPKATLCTMYVAQGAAGSESSLNAIQGTMENLAAQMLRDGKVAVDAESLEGQARSAT